MYIQSIHTTRHIQTTSIVTLCGLINSCSRCKHMFLSLVIYAVLSSAMKVTGIVLYLNYVIAKISKKTDFWTNLHYCEMVHTEMMYFPEIICIIVYVKARSTYLFIPMLVVYLISLICRHWASICSWQCLANDNIF